MSNINIQTALNYMYHLMNIGCTYSMEFSRTGADGTADCSGAVYQALRNAGASNAGWVLNTDSLHDWLLKNGFKLVAKNKEANPKKGWLFILGEKGASGGRYGHTGFFTGEKENIIHCNAGANGVSIDDFNTMYNRSVAITPQLKTWYFYEYQAGTSTQNNNYKYNVGETVKLLNHATHYSTGEGIPQWVKNKNYRILERGKRGDKNKYLLQGIMSWVLEQDLGK